MIESFQKYADENGYEVLEITKSVDENTIGNGRIPETIDAAYIEKDGTVYLLKKNGTIERIGTKEYWDKIQKWCCPYC